MRRAERLFEIIEILRTARGPMSAASIGAELGVTKRTIYRDIAALSVQGVPVEGEAGVGYVLAAGFHMPPVMLSPDESEAAVLGALWVQARGEPELAAAATRLIAKLEAVVPERLRTHFIDPGLSVAPGEPVAEGLPSSEARQAIRQRRKIRLVYRDGQGGETERTVWPILLGYREAGRILAAWCELRAGFRYFRTERVLRAEILEERIPRRMDILRADWKAAMAAERARYGRIDPT